MAFVNIEPKPILVHKIPTICSIKPSNSGLSENELNELLVQTKISVEEWMTKLQVGLEDKDAWKINYVEISGVKEWKYNNTNCDIVIFYKDKPTNISQHHRIGGLTTFDEFNERQIITIYYFKTEICPTTDGIKIYFNQCYKNNLRTPFQLQAIIQHEIGHALGLDHYVQKDFLLNLGEHVGIKEKQSIMIDTAPDNINKMKITSIDIKNLQTLYGEDGFR